MGFGTSLIIIVDLLGLNWKSSCGRTGIVYISLCMFSGILSGESTGTRILK